MHPETRAVGVKHHRKLLRMNFENPVRNVDVKSRIWISAD